MATPSRGKPPVPEADAPINLRRERGSFLSYPVPEPDTPINLRRGRGFFHDLTISMKRLLHKEKKMAETAVSCRLVVNWEQLVDHAACLSALKRLINHANDLIENVGTKYPRSPRYQITSLGRAVEIFWTILREMMHKLSDLDSDENLATQIGQVASKLENIRVPTDLHFPIEGAKQICYQVMDIKAEVVNCYEKVCGIQILLAAENPSYWRPLTSNSDILQTVEEISEIEASFCVADLEALINCAPIFIQHENVRIGSLHNGLHILRAILALMEKKCYEHENAESLVRQIRGVASKAVSLETNPKTGTNEVKDIMVEVMDIYDNICDLRVLQTGSASDGCPSRASNTIGSDETVVGFEDEATTVKDQLTRGRTEQLEVVSVIGMPGLGKTTLARKVYNDGYVTHHFRIRAWTYVSQVYKKRECLLEILRSLVNLEDEDEDEEMSKLGERLYKSLKGKRYLIVMDDIWSIEAWNDIRVYLPNDNTGSKVLFTTRLAEVVLRANSVPHFLRFLTKEESWELFHGKVFQKQNFPPDLMEIGLQITRNFLRITTCNCCNSRTSCKD